MPEIPLASVERVIRGSLEEGMRIGSDAVERLCEILEEYAIELSKKAAFLAKHAKRKTVKAEDLELALK